MYAFVFSHLEKTAHWAGWAEQEVASWPDRRALDDAQRTLDVFRRALDRSADLVSGD